MAQKLFDEPIKDENGTWHDTVTAKLLRECRAVSAALPNSFAAAMLWLTLLKLLQHVLVPKSANVAMNTLFDGQPLGRLHAALVGDFKPPKGFVLDEEGALIEEVDDPFGGEGKVTKVNITLLGAHVEALCESAQKMLDADLVSLTDAAAITLKSK